MAANSDSGDAAAATAVGAAQSASAETANATPARRFIREYRVTGAKHLPATEVDAAVYPFLGPDRTEDDIRRACEALVNAYRARGLQTVAAQPATNQPAAFARKGIVLLQVAENPVGRLRIVGAKYTAPSRIKEQAPAVAEGQVLDFAAVNRDIVALNRQADRRVAPTLRPGVEPGTVDVDLEVKEQLPLHASVELNNRAGPDTTPLRLNGSISATNLWQAGHTLGLSFQTSPQNTSEVKVFSGYYLVPLPNLPTASVMVQGVKQDSNVSTLGGLAVAGRGETLGLRFMLGLPTWREWAQRPAPAGSDRSQFYHSFSVGLDYKKYDQLLTVPANSTGGTTTSDQPTVVLTPTKAYPLAANYTATIKALRPAVGPTTKPAAGAAAGEPEMEVVATTEFNAGVNFHFRGTGSSPAENNKSRFGADGGYFVFRGDLAQTVALARGYEIFGKVQGQIADRPLLSAEQYTGGGSGTVRGYLEAEATGDSAVFGSLELRSPSFVPRRWGEWRCYVFGDMGRLTVVDPLPEQQARFDLASVGAGSRFQLWQHFTGGFDVGWALKDVQPNPPQGTTARGTKAHEVRVTFRAGVEY